MSCGSEDGSEVDLTVFLGKLSEQIAFSGPEEVEIEACSGDR